MTGPLFPIYEYVGFKPIPIATKPLTFKIPNEMRAAEHRHAALTDQAVAKFAAAFEAQCQIAFDKGPDWIVGVSPVEMSDDFIITRQFVVVQGPANFDEYEGWTFFGQGART